MPENATLVYIAKIEKGELYMIYSLIIIGAGAAGLYAGASRPNASEGEWLILEKSRHPGQKLLLAGGGQCNLTHGGSIKEFSKHYGSHGRKVRPVLYRHSNQSVAEFFENLGVRLIEREDGKVFPASLNSVEVVDALVKRCKKNGIDTVYSSQVIGLERSEDHFTIICTTGSYQCRNVLIATGGCSYPATGSDGNFFGKLENLGFNIIKPRPALVPIYVQSYPYASCAGMTFNNAKLSIMRKDQDNQFKDKKKPIECSGSLLLTHTGFSGPLILDNSRYLSPGDKIRINYFPGLAEDILSKEIRKAASGSKKQLITFMIDFFKGILPEKTVDLPKRFLENLCEGCQINPTVKASQLPWTELRKLVERIIHDEFIVNNLGDLKSAMVTAGGVDLEDVDLRTMEAKQMPGLYFAGEVLDADGDSGGYNLQFAFSSAYIAANSQNL